MRGTSRKTKAAGKGFDPPSSVGNHQVCLHRGRGPKGILVGGLGPNSPAHRGFPPPSMLRLISAHHHCSSSLLVITATQSSALLLITLPPPAFITASTNRKGGVVLSVRSVTTWTSCFAKYAPRRQRLGDQISLPTFLLPGTNVASTSCGRCAIPNSFAKIHWQSLDSNRSLLGLHLGVATSYSPGVVSTGS